MTFSLEVFDPSGATLLDTITEASPPIIKGSPDITVRPPGEPVEFSVRYRPDLTSIPPRAILKYVRNGTALFHGVVVSCPRLDSPGAGPADEDRDALELLRAEGSRRLTTETICEDLFIDTGADVATIALTLCVRYAHSALTAPGGNFGATGFILNAAAYPEETLSDALDDLAERSTGAWWVDALGALHFGPA